MKSIDVMTLFHLDLVIMKLQRKANFCIFLLSATFLCGCGIAREVTANDLDWQPPKLGAGQCPDLSGDYTFKAARTSSEGYVTDLLPIYAGSIYVLWKTAGIDPATGRSQQPLSPNQISDFQSYYAEAEKKDGDNISNVLHIEQTKSRFIQGSSGETRVVTRLGTEMASCAEEVLIFRTFEKNGGPDFTPRIVSYGELEISKDVNGALKVTQRKRQKSISFSSGMAGDRKEFSPVTRIYPLTQSSIIK